MKYLFLLFISLTNIVLQAQIEAPYSGTPISIPGTVEAENYDLGGSNVAYYDATVLNQGAQYRTTDQVDIEVCTEGGYNIGYTANNEWLKYSINVLKADTFDFLIRTASNNVGTGGSMHIEIDGTDVTGLVALPLTGGWQVWQTTTVPAIKLAQGNHIMRIFIDVSGFNLNYVTLQKAKPVLPPVPPIPGKYLHASGQNIVDSTGKSIILRGIGTGNWMINEGYMMQTADIAPTNKSFRDRLTQTIGATRTAEFYDAWLANHMTKKDVDSMAAWGFNSIRVVMHYKWFTLPIEQELIKGQNTWIDKGFTLIDSILKWCSANHMYVILDMHGTPGGQGNDANISDYETAKPSLWQSVDNQNKLTSLWAKLAERYANSPWIGGYDLINETNWDVDGAGGTNGCNNNQNTQLTALQKRLIDAIRVVDKNHIVYVSGNCWENNFNGMQSLFSYDANLAISFHKYWNNNDLNSISGFIALRSTYNKPLWMGEGGENSNHWFSDAIGLLEKNNIGWSWWPVKKSATNNVLKVTTNADYTQMINMWKGNGNMTADAAYKAVMQWATNHKIENCEVARDVIYAMMSASRADVTAPFKPHTVNQKIYAVDYDMGRNGIASFDNVYGNYGNWAAWNTGNIYRNDGVDITTCNDAGETNGYYVGWTETNEWMNYTITVPQTSAYDLVVRSAGGGAIHVEVDGKNVTGILALANAGGAQTFANTTVKAVNLTAGTHVIKLVIETAGCNLNYFEFIKNVSTQTIVLNQGWNLISTNIVPTDSSIATLFTGLDVQEIKTMDAFWRKGQNNAFNLLQSITTGKGYLVNMNVGGSLKISGFPLTNLSLPIPNTGWQLLGCPYQTATLFSTVYSATNSQYIKNFIGFWTPAGTLNSITNFEPGKGYFLKGK